MLSHNAAKYTKHALKTLKNANGGYPYELIVLDNASDETTKKMLSEMKKEGYIDKLIFEKTNTYFAKGNNIASQYCDPNSKYILLLNSDVEIRDKYWLRLLVENHKRGSTAYGVCEGDPFTRGDGYCFLIDKDLYLKYKLDETFEWWWSVTKLQAQLLNDGYELFAVKKHESLIHHYGGMSGKDWRNSKGMNVEGEEIKKWVKSGTIKVILEIKGSNPSCNTINLINISTSISKTISKHVDNFSHKLYR